MDDAAVIAPEIEADLYDRDFYAWGLRQAALLRAGRLAEIDVENIAEEIESLSRSEKRELVSRLVILVVHLLKWRYQPLLQGRSWQSTIEEQRFQIGEYMEENPSLRPLFDVALTSAYRQGRRRASIESGLPNKTFPEVCPWSTTQLLNEDYLPPSDE